MDLRAGAASSIKTQELSVFATAAEKHANASRLVLNWNGASATLVPYDKSSSSSCRK